MLVAAPQRIVIGGGVSKTPGLRGRIHDSMLRALSGYALNSAIKSPDLIAPPALGDDSGLIGALMLAGR